MFQLYVNGTTEPDDWTNELAEQNDDRFRIQLEDVNRSSGYPEACRHCGEAITEDGGAWLHDDPQNPDDPARCELDDDEDEPQTAEPGPFAWCNSAAITLDPDDDSVTVSISVGDPRGAFTMTVRRLTDGSLVLHHPHPSDSMPHMPTSELRPGTLGIG